MNLLLIADNFPNPLEPTRGIFNLELAKALAVRHQVRVVSPVSWLREWKGGSLGRERETILDGIKVYYPRFYYTPKVLRRFYGSFLWWSVRRTVLSLLKEQRPDAVLGYWAHPDGEVAVRAARLAGVPAAVMVGGSDVLLLTKDSRRCHCITRVLRDADAVVTTSQDLKDKLGELGIDAGKVHVVYRGVDRARFCPGSRTDARQRLGIPLEGKSLIAVGRLVPVKGFDVLLEACAILRRQQPFRLYLIGDGPLRENLQVQAQALGLSDVVHFAGLVRHECLPDWYRAADLTVLSSHSEGIPNVLRESLACSTPFVASRVGGVPELAGGSANRLFPPGDSDALAERLAAALMEGSDTGLTDCSTQGWDESAEKLVRILARSRCPHPVATLPVLL